MSDDIFYDDFGNGIDDRICRVFNTRREAEEYLKYCRGFLQVRYDKYGNKEYVVFYYLNS